MGLNVQGVCGPLRLLLIWRMLSSPAAAPSEAAHSGIQRCLLDVDSTHHGPPIGIGDSQDCATDGHPPPRKAGPVVLGGKGLLGKAQSGMHFPKYSPYAGTSKCFRKLVQMQISELLPRPREALPGGGARGWDPLCWETHASSSSLISWLTLAATSGLSVTVCTMALESLEGPFQLLACLVSRRAGLQTQELKRWVEAARGKQGHP